MSADPDKVPAEERDAAEKRFQQINNGNTLLTDEKKRAQYDDGTMVPIAVVLSAQTFLLGFRIDSCT